jgi:asparagine synthetase A
MSTSYFQFPDPPCKKFICILDAMDKQAGSRLEKTEQEAIDLLKVASSALKELENGDAGNVPKAEAMSLQYVASVKSIANILIEEIDSLANTKREILKSQSTK